MDDDVTKELIDRWLGEAASPASLDALNTAIARLLREGRARLEVACDHTGRGRSVSLVPVAKEGAAHVS